MSGTTPRRLLALGAGWVVAFVAFMTLSTAVSYLRTPSPLVAFGRVDLYLCGWPLPWLQVGRYQAANPGMIRIGQASYDLGISNREHLAVVVAAHALMALVAVGFGRRAHGEPRPGTEVGMSDQGSFREVEVRIMAHYAGHLQRLDMPTMFVYVTEADMYFGVVFLHDLGARAWKFSRTTGRLLREADVAEYTEILAFVDSSFEGWNGAGGSP